MGRSHQFLYIRWTIDREPIALPYILKVFVHRMSIGNKNSWCEWAIRIQIMTKPLAKYIHTRESDRTIVQSELRPPAQN